MIVTLRLPVDYGVIGPYASRLSEEGDVLRATCRTAADAASLRELAHGRGWPVLDSRLGATLSPTQQRAPLDELVWDTLRGVAESLTFDGEYCTRRVYFRAGDIGGEPLIDVRYQYEIRSGRVVSDTSTIAYPYTDGGGLTVAGQVYIRDYPAPPLGDGKTPPDGTLGWSTE